MPSRKRSLEDKIELGLIVALVVVMAICLGYFTASAVVHFFTQQHAHEVSAR